MMLLRTAGRREGRHNLWLGGSTAITAGFVNVCSVVAFFAFSSNVTGHVAIFAEEVVKGHWHQVSVVGIWLGMFLCGAFLANLLITTIGSRNVYVGHSLPLLIEMLTLAIVGYYGHHHYTETLRETEYLVSALLFAMGIQNGMVATASNSVVRTTHLTGLFTDLGMELSMMTQARFRRDHVVRFKLWLHLTILAGYVVGGLLGGAMYLAVGFRSLYAASVILGFILAHDVVVLWLFSRQQALSWNQNKSWSEAPGADGDA